MDCDDDDPCTVDECDAQRGCVYTDSQASCDDGDPCTSNDVCTRGSCAGDAMDCSGLDGDCTIGVCDSSPGRCQARPLDDGAPCNGEFSEGGVCRSGVCVSGDGRGDGGQPDSTADDDDRDGGCGCRVGRKRPVEPPGTILLAFLSLAAVFRLGRRL